MNQKIEWYREVLELEPGSRVFFPLARLLAEENDFAGAIGVLETGLLRHPDHIEARLLHVELLSGHGTGDALQAELATLAKLFGKYPSFWKIWSAGLAVNPGMQDAALAMNFLGAALGGKPVTWASVIARGLESVLGESLPVTPFAGAVVAPVPPVAVPAEPYRSFQPVSATAPVEAVQPSVSPGFDTREGAGEGRLKSFALVSNASFSEDEQDEPFTLRTRSMADVLAEQGDTAGALEIYSELLANASDDAKPALQQRIDYLSSMASPAPSATAKPGPEESMEGERVISLFEALAQRFEARAR